MRKILALLCFLVSISCFSQPASPSYIPKETKHYFNWGKDTTVIMVSQYGKRKDIVMINLHADETTSVEAAKSILAETGGLLIQIENDTTRLISFEKNGKEFQLDPNRIFTANGLQQNFEKLNGSPLKPAIHSIESFGKFILKQIPKSAKTLIALHNNNDSGYSIESYKEDGMYANDVLKIHTNTAFDPDDFFLVTNQAVFIKLRAAGYNVVLQNNKRAKDDGSLSIYYGRKKKNYINVEAEHDHVNEQSEMLRSLLGFLNKYSL
jgi:hypothetical protein